MDKSSNAFHKTTHPYDYLHTCSIDKENSLPISNAHRHAMVTHQANCILSLFTICKVISKCSSKGGFVDKFSRHVTSKRTNDVFSGHARTTCVTWFSSYHRLLERLCNADDVYVLGNYVYPQHEVLLNVRNQKVKECSSYV